MQHLLIKDQLKRIVDELTREDVSTLRSVLSKLYDPAHTYANSMVLGLLVTELMEKDDANKATPASSLD